jgi:iron complex outermembrane recepter protein
VTASLATRILCALVLALPLHAVVASAEEPESDLTALGLEDLMNIEVTSVSRKREKRSGAAAALYVITQEDIRRSGATSIPEALRLAPGIEVSRIDANKWAIGVRGFGSRLARSMLVLIDGRSVYTPLFAGTYWEVQDTLLEDVDRIEVIRGPGGTLWGANAVNGVINIITKHSRDTQGGLLTGGGGTEERAFGGARYGGKLGDSLTYRVYGKYFDRDGGFMPGGDDYDAWHMSRGGFRTDWQMGPQDTLKLQGDLYDGDAGQRTAITRFRPPFPEVVDKDATLSGSNMLGRWRHVVSDSSDLALQAYYDNTYRREVTFRERRDTFDLDFQHRFGIPWRQEIIWGLGYRLTADDTSAVRTIIIDPRDRTDHLYSVFVQDEITLVEDVLRLIAGSKFEHNDYSGFEYQPSGRLVWTPTGSHVVWGAVSRAVRTPSRIDHDLELTSGPTAPDTFLRLQANEDFTTEKVVSYELGYRVQPLTRLFLDAAVFYNEYDDLQGLDFGTPFTENVPPPTRLIIPVVFRNNLHGSVHGIELGADAVLTSWWRLHGSYSYVKIELEPDADDATLDASIESIEGTSAHNRVSLHSSMDLPWSLEFDQVVRYVDNLPAQRIGPYFNVDVRVARKMNRYVELAIVGQNLVEDHHREFAGGTEVERGAYGKVTIRW